MTDEERRAARAALISGLSIRQLITDLEGKRYADLVAKHMREIGPRLPATIAVHEDLVMPEEGAGVREILANVTSEAMQPSFWTADAGNLLSSVSCELNDALFPRPVEDAGVFNLFQLITASLADRARIDPDYRATVLEPPRGAIAPSPELGTITRMLGIAISDYDAGRISKGHLLSIFQGAIDNGDILEESNQLYVVANVLPLVDAHLLRPSEHLRAFDARLNKMAASFLAERRTNRLSATRERTMNTSMGALDALFGEKISIDLPQSDGTSKKVTVTKRWMEEMIRRGKIKDVTASIVKVNILDPDPRIPEGCTDPEQIMEALGADVPLLQVEHWQIGVRVSREQYDKFLDPASKELYAMRKHDDGQSRTFLVQRSLWDQARKAMEDL